MTGFRGFSWGLLALVLSGCPGFFPDESAGEQPCQNDPAGCHSEVGESPFSRNPDCGPTGPLDVELGQGTYRFEPLALSSELVTHFGAQGGSHADFAVRVSGVDLEASPRLRVTLETIDVEGECVHKVPAFETSIPYFLWGPVGHDTGVPLNQPGCMNRPCEDGAACLSGRGCHPSLCFVDGSVAGEHGWAAFGAKCAEDCAGGVCFAEEIAVPEPGCALRECGNDGRGGFCGACGAGEVCSLDGHCVSDCPNDAGCGDFCSPCPTNAVCEDGVCIVKDPNDQTCIAGISGGFRVLILGQSHPLVPEENGWLEVTGITVFDPGIGSVRVRVEDMCGNVGFHVLPR